MIPTAAGYEIIWMVFLISAITAVLIALATYLIDKGAGRRDR